MTTKVKNTVDLVRDAVASLNKIEATAASTTRLLAASCMVFTIENGGDKPARNRLVVMLDDIATEGVAKHVLAWVGKNGAKYEPFVRAAMPEGAEAARDAVLEQFGDRPWRDIRSEHNPDKVKGGNPTPPPAKTVPADGPLKKIDAPAPEAHVVEVLPIAPVERVLALLEGLDADALEQVVMAANALLTQRAERLAAAQDAALSHPHGLAALVMAATAEPAREAAEPIAA